MSNRRHEELGPRKPAGKLVPFRPEDDEIDWIDGDPDRGIWHIRAKGVEPEEVEEVLRQDYCPVEVKAHPAYPDCLIFLGKSHAARELFISCKILFIEGRRVFQPITAFQPKNPRKYWQRQERTGPWPMS